MKGKIIIFTMALISAEIWAKAAQFEVQATFNRNPSIWGTYKLSAEKITITRGKKTWRKTPPKRIGDMVISNGNIIFIRENKINGQTKIVVDKLPYKKIGKKKYQAKARGHKDKIARLYESDLKQSIPHKDLQNGAISYEEINCKRKQRGRIICKITGELNPN